MEKVFITDDDEPEVITGSAKDRYMLALNELTGTLPLEGYHQLDTERFFRKYGVKESFLLALRDLDAIFLNMTTGKTHCYGKTGDLYKLTPQDVSSKVRSLGQQKRHQNKDGASAPEVFVVKPDPTEEVPMKTERRVWPDTYLQPDTKQPLLPDNSYTLRAKSDRYDLRMEIGTPQDRLLFEHILTQLTK